MSVKPIISSAVVMPYNSSFLELPGWAPESVINTVAIDNEHSCNYLLISIFLTIFVSKYLFLFFF